MLKNFAGMSGSYWFLGIVEDNLDPEKSGRVKVRCFGLHTENLNKISTDSLPWALVGVSTNSSSSDIGSISIGTCVYGIFLDAMEQQIPFVTNVVPGLHIGINNKIGFNNFKENPPKEGDHTGNIHSRVHNIPDRVYYADRDSANGANISEPKQKRKPKYPSNIATVTDGGHIIERDDTPSQERLCIQHIDGSYIEMNQEHNMILKTINDMMVFCQNYNQSVEKDRNIAVQGNDNLKVMGNKTVDLPDGNYILNANDCNITLKGNGTTNIDGNYNVNVKGNMTHNVTGNYSLKAGGAINMKGASLISKTSGVTIIDGSMLLLG